MMLILQRYDLKVKYVPGSELSVDVALSRWYKPFTCSAAHGSKIEIVPTNKD